MAQAPSPQVELPTTLAYAQGGYSVALAVGSERQAVHVALDTGSSTLAFFAHGYDPARDALARPTALAQEIRYGGGAWAGPVLRSRLAFGDGRHARAIDDAPFALVESVPSLFRRADGILGLAYAPLDPAHDLAALLRDRGIDPVHTWPWPFPAGHEFDLAAFDRFLRAQPRTTLQPAFDALEEHGVTRNRFGLTVGRGVVHVATDGASVHAQAADPLNRGTLVLGGGHEQQHLYRGGFADVAIVDDRWYATELRAVQVGADDPVPVPPTAAGAASPGNALLDTGSSFLVLEATTYDAVLAAFARHDPRFPALVAEAQQALAANRGLANERVDPHAWPDLHLHLAAPGGGTTALRVHASAYWPRNALAHGQTLCLLMRGQPSLPKASILGLPLFAGRYAVFDRAAAGGLGVVRFAEARG